MGIGLINVFEAGSDYVYFFYGLSFLFLGAVCFLIKKRREGGLDWTWLGLFGGTYGLHAWIELTGIFLGGDRLLDAMGLATVVVACFCLLQFSRHYFFSVLPNKGILSYCLFFAVFLFAGGVARWTPVALKALTTYVLYLPAGILASLVFLKAAKNNNNDIFLHGLSRLMLFDAFSSVFEVSRQPFFPLNYLNEENFYRFFGFSPPFVRGVAAFCITVTALGYFREKVFSGVKHRWVNWKVLLLLEAAVLISGAISTNKINSAAERRMRLELLNRAQTAAAVIDGDRIAQASRAPAGELNEQGIIKKQLAKLIQTAPELRRAYLLGADKDAERIFFLADSVSFPAAHPTIQGSIYGGASEHLRNVFLVARPFTDSTPKYTGYGVTGISAFVPILGDDGRGVLAVLGVDVDALWWERGILFARIGPIFITLVIALLVFAIFIFSQTVIFSNIQLSQSRTNLLEAQHLAHVGSFNCDMPTDTMVWSDETFLIHGRDRMSKEPAWSSYAQFIYPEDVLLFKKKLDEVFAQPVRDTLEMEYRIVVKEDSPRYLRLEVAVHRDAEKRAKGFSGTVQDITETKNTELALRHAKEEAEAASAAKNIFLAKMSHEIRTPMNAIVGFSTLLKTTPLDDLQKEHLGMIIESGENLVNIITDILDTSKIEFGHVALVNSDFNLEYLMESLIRIVTHKIDAARVELRYEFDPSLPKYFNGDPTRMRQIVFNLLTNAIKFTEKGSIAVSVVSQGPCVMDGDKGHKMAISVKDTGTGIPRDKIDEIFKPFAYADGAGRKRYGGAGLGLVIVKGFITAMGGDVRVESEVGRGSLFVLTLCLKEGEPITSQEIQLVPLKQLDGKKVLIADRDERCRAVLRSYCEDIGMSAILLDATTPGILCRLDELNDHALPDFIIADVALSVNEGLDLPQALRNVPRYAPIKIIAITSEALPNTLPIFQKAGFNGYLSKPLLKRDVFRVFLAVWGDKRREPQIVTRHTAEELALKGVKILVVEDNAINRKLALALLAKFGCSVDEATDGREAVEQIKKSDYDIVLMDIEMPFMDGVEATRVIRQDLKKNAPVIGLTAAVRREDEERARGAGMNDFLTKPIDVAKLKKTLLIWSRRE